MNEGIFIEAVGILVTVVIGLLTIHYARKQYLASRKNEGKDYVYIYFPPRKRTKL